MYYFKLKASVQILIRLLSSLPTKKETMKHHGRKPHQNILSGNINEIREEEGITRVSRRLIKGVRLSYYVVCLMPTAAH